MTGPVSTYLAFGLYFLLLTNHDYRKQAKPSPIQFVGYCGLCMFCWPWLVWMMGKRS